MRTIAKNGLSRFVVACLFALPITGFSQGNRMAGPIEGNRTFVMKGNVHPKALPANDRGALNPTTVIPYMRMSLQPTAQQTADLEQLLEAQRDPALSDYHRWLTPEEYGERFGVSQDDLERIAAWLQSEGFIVEQKARARNWIAFTGTAERVNKAFRAELRRYESDGETHFSNAVEPSIPLVLAGIVGELHGLNDFRLKPPRVKNNASDYTIGAGGHYLAPDDLAAIYDISPLYRAGYDGTGQKLAIVGQTDINLADIRGFRSQFGLPVKDPQLVLFGPDPGVSSGDQIESDLDLEWAGAVARNATILFVYSLNVFESVQYVIDQNLAPVISMSYGGCEIGVSASNRVMVQQANAEGITWMNSSGDSGAAGCDWGGPAAAQYGPAVSFPADIPEITAVGGTEFNESGNAGWNNTNSATGGSATGYLPEKAWNDTPSGGGIWGSGGGASVVFPKPWWQTGPGVPNDGARDVPDISLTASGVHDGYLIYANGGLYSVGGTSASSPSFAGLVALINQYVMANGYQAIPGLGNINPTLYSLAQNASGAIHDIIVGDNIVPCVSNSTGCSTGSFGYRAGTGYDLVTGLGSVDAYNLVTKWAGGSTSVGTTSSLTASPASISVNASTQLTARITAVTGSNPPTGSVNFMLGGVSLGSAAVAASGTTATAVLTVMSPSLTAGANTITANYAPSGNFSASLASATVMLNVPVATRTVLAASPASILSTGATQLTAMVTPASGSAAPTGSMVFLSGSVTLGTATLASTVGGAATATLSVSASKLAIGTNNVTASYAGSAAFNGSVSTAVALTVTAPLVTTTATLVPNPTSIVGGASAVLTFTVRPASGTTSPAGTVIFMLGNTTLGAAALAATGGTATASLGVRGVSLAPGSNSIVANYGGDARFGGSAAATTVTVTGVTVATTTAVAANPPSIAQNGGTTITALVKPVSGAALSSGTVSFTLGNTLLGSAPVTSAAGLASAVMTLPGSKLSLGSNIITASYAGVTGFGASLGTVRVEVTAPPVGTVLTVAASPASIPQTGTTQLTAAVRTGSGGAPPSGNVTFTVGGVSLGVASLTPSGGAATATLTVRGSSLAVGSNAVTASYAGSSAFTSSTGSSAINIVVTSAASNVVLTATKTTNSQPGFAVKVQLQDIADGATTLTGFSVNGANFDPAIASFFGGTQIAAHATLASIMNVQWSPVPATLVFAFNGVDPSGRQWSQTVSLVTQ